MLATIIGQGVTFDIALLYFVVKKKLHICINAGEFWSLCKSIFKVGLAPFILRVSDRFSEYKENPENTGFSGSVALFRYSLELSL